VLDDGLVLTTRHPDRLIARRLTASDAPAFARHVARNLAHLGVFLPWPAVTDTPDGAARWLGGYERREDGRVVALGAWQGQELLGGAVLFQHDANQANVELGCWVAAEGEGQGVASALCRMLLVVAHADLAAQRVEWRTASNNKRSRGLAERLGFRYEGTLRSIFVLRGSRLDMDVLSLVGEEIREASQG
jgi:ribosomal-protein-serine acetyltransferase